MSDLHLEFSPMNSIAPLPTDKDGVLVLAGDICPYRHKSTLLNFLRNASAQFSHVLYVLGNHEFYGYGSLTDGYEIVRRMIREAMLDNVHLLEQDQYSIGNITFIGATLWTNYRNRNPFVMEVARAQMVDHVQILGKTDELILPDEIYEAHTKSNAYVWETVAKAMHHDQSAVQRVVVITHHGVSLRSIHPRYQGDPLNDAFVSDLSENILDTQPHLMLHGHVHDHFDYKIGDTRIIANPRGYPGEKTGWDENFVIEI